MVCGMGIRLTILSILIRRATVALALVACGSGCALHGPPAPAADVGGSESVQLRTVRVALPSGATDVDLYYAAGEGARPLIVVAHGFSRSKANMANWGRKLAGEGFIVAVPALPAWIDHARNGRFINELIGHLQASPPEGLKVDRQRTGLLGFSSGGLTTLLAAADNPTLRVYVGLDPVDYQGMGAAVAGKVRCHVAIIRAEPSWVNHNGNAVEMERALKVPFVDVMVPGAIHSDPEWPTEWVLELVGGRAAEERRAVFVQKATATLRSQLGGDRPGMDEKRAGSDVGR